MTASTLQRQDSVEAEPGEGTPLAGRHVAGRLWRRYGATPGLISVAPARRLIASASRFGAGRVRLPGQGPQQGSLLESIQRRFGVPGSYGRAGGPGLRLGQLPYLAPAVAPAASAEPHAAGPDAAEPHAAGRMGSGNPGVHGPTQPSPQALQARVQALLRLPLTARAVQAKTAGRESMALAGEIVERRRSGALERALQQAPAVMRVTAQAASVGRPEPPPNITDRELRRAVAPAGAAPDQLRPIVTTGAGRSRAAGGGAQTPAPGAPASGVAAQGPQATRQPVETAQQVTSVAAGGLPEAGFLPEAPPPVGAGSGVEPSAGPSLPVVRAVQAVRRSPAGITAGEADRSAGLESTGPAYRQARQDQMARRAVEPVAPGGADEIRRETSGAKPPASTGGRLSGTGGQAVRGSGFRQRAAPGALGAVVVERSFSLSHVQRALSGDPRHSPQQGTLVRAAAVTRAAGRAMMQPAPLRTLLREDALPAPDTDGRRETAPGAEPGGPAPRSTAAGTEATSSPTVRPGDGTAAEGAISAASATPLVQTAGAGSAQMATSSGGTSTAPGGRADLPHVTPGVLAAQTGPAEGTNSQSQSPADRIGLAPEPGSAPVRRAALAGEGSMTPPGGAGVLPLRGPLLRQGALPLARSRGAVSRRAGGPGARSSDSASGFPPELPVVQLAAGVGSHGGQDASVTTGTVAAGRVEAQMPVAIPVPAATRWQGVDAIVAQGMTEATAQRASLRDGAIGPQAAGPHVSRVAARSGIEVAAERGVRIARVPILAPGAVAQGGIVLRRPFAKGPVMQTVSSDEVLGALPVVRAGSGTGGSAGTPGIGEVVTPDRAGAARARASLDGIDAHGFGAHRPAAQAATPAAPSLPHLQLKSIFAGGSAAAGTVVQAAPSGEVRAGYNPGSQMIARKTARRLAAASSGSGPGTVLLQRDGDSGSDPAPVSESPTTTAPTADQGNSNAGVDLPRMADQVYELIRRRLIRERESMG